MFVTAVNTTNLPSKTVKIFKILFICNFNFTHEWQLSIIRVESIKYC